MFTSLFRATVTYDYTSLKRSTAAAATAAADTDQLADDMSLRIYKPNWYRCGDVTARPRETVTAGSAVVRFLYIQFFYEYVVADLSLVRLDHTVVWLI